MTDGERPQSASRARNPPESERPAPRRPEVGRLTRRRALQAVGAGGAVALAGCIGGGGSCDLSLRKEHSGDPVTYGSTTEFEITVCNDGDGRCTDTVTVTDDLPAGTTYDSVAGSGWTASESGGVVTCEHPNGSGLGSGDCLPTLTLTVEVGQPDQAGTELANCATVEQGDADTKHKTGCAKVPIEPPAGECDLAISKSYDGDVVTAGSPATFQIEVCNEGDGVCRESVTVVDGLPSGVTFGSASGAGWSVSQSGGSVVATHDNSSGLNAGACLPVLELTLDIGSMDETGDAIRNCASLKVEDADAANDLDCVTVPVRPGGGGDCDLTIEKTYDGDVVLEGGAATFEIVVCNEGEGVCAEEVSVVDALPSGVTYQMGTGTGWAFSETGGTVTATHPNGGGLAPGECLPTMELNVQFGSIDETGDQIQNCASIEGSDADNDNNRDCVSVPVQPDEGDGKCDLAIEKTYDGDVVTEGSGATFQIEVCNEGDGRCGEAVTVVDSLPGGVTFGSASGTGWAVSQSGGVVTATHDNSSGLAAGECLPVLELTLDIGSMAATGDQVRNCASLEVADANAANDLDCVSVPVQPGDGGGDCDLAVTKTFGGDAVVEETDVDFEVTVCNEGDGTCDEPVTVVDALPSGVTFEMGAGSGWSFNESGGTVTATHPNAGGLAPGECLPTMEVNVHAGSMEETGDQIRNCAFIEGADPNQGNDNDCVTVPVQPTPGECDLAVTKTHAGGDVVTEGEETTFNIVVCNQGDGDCDGQVTVTDDLPDGVTFSGAGGNGWTVSESGGVVTATHTNGGGLAPGDCLPTLLIEVQVGSIDETGDQIRNCADIQVDDAEPRNDRDCTVVTVTQPTGGCNGLEIEKLAATQFTYGDQEDYEIRVCNPTDAQCDGQVIVTDDLPDGISYVSHTGTGWNVSVSGGVVTATHPNNGTLSPGSCLPTLTLTVDVLPAAQFPGGSDAVQNCAELVANGAIVDEDCVTHVITNQ